MSYNPNIEKNRLNIRISNQRCRLLSLPRQISNRRKIHISFCDLVFIRLLLNSINTLKSMIRMHCFITPVNLIAICLCLLFLAPASLSLAQTACPPPAVSTFSATHGRPGAYRECGTKALQNSNGEYVVVGYEGDLQNPYNALYFARFDASGQTIGDKNEIFLVENGTLWSLYEGQPAHLLKETQLIEVLSNNQPNGYLVAVTAEQVGATPDVLLVRLDQEGCVVWTRRIVEGGLQIPVGLFQNAA